MADAADDLFTVPPAQFVAARDQVVSALKKAGQKDEAATVKALTRPHAAEWAVNQVARRSPDEMARFLELSAAVAAAQMGGGDYQGALAGQRAALEALVAAAAQALRGAELSDDRAVLDRVANDLRWAAVGEETRALL